MPDSIRSGDLRRRSRFERRYNKPVGWLYDWWAPDERQHHRRTAGEPRLTAPAYMKAPNPWNMGDPWALMTDPVRVMSDFTISIFVSANNHQALYAHVHDSQAIEIIR